MPAKQAASPALLSCPSSPCRLHTFLQQHNIALSTPTRRTVLPLRHIPRASHPSATVPMPPYRGIRMHPRAAKQLQLEVRAFGAVPFHLCQGRVGYSSPRQLGLLCQGYSGPWPAGLLHQGYSGPRPQSLLHHDYSGPRHDASFVMATLVHGCASFATHLGSGFFRPQLSFVALRSASAGPHGMRG